MSESKFVIEQSSKFGFDRTVEILVAESERREWKVPAVHDFSSRLQNQVRKLSPSRLLKYASLHIQDRCLNLTMSG